MLFPDVPLPERPAVAAGFTGAKFWKSSAEAVSSDRDVDRFVSAITNAGVRLIRLDFVAGDMPCGDRGRMFWRSPSSEFRGNIPVPVWPRRGTRGRWPRAALRRAGRAHRPGRGRGRRAERRGADGGAGASPADRRAPGCGARRGVLRAGAVGCRARRCDQRLREGRQPCLGTAVRAGVSHPSRRPRRRRVPRGAGAQVGQRREGRTGETVAQLREIAVRRLNEVVGAMDEHARSDTVGTGVGPPARHDEKGSRR